MSENSTIPQVIATIDIHFWGVSSWKNGSIPDLLLIAW